MELNSAKTITYQERVIYTELSPRVPNNNNSNKLYLSVKSFSAGTLKSNVDFWGKGKTRESGENPLRAE